MTGFRRVAAYASPGAAALGLGLTSAIFRARPDLAPFEFTLCAAQPGPLTTDLGAPVLVEHGPELFAQADLILLLPGDSFAEPPPGPVISALLAAHRPLSNNGTVVGVRAPRGTLLAPLAVPMSLGRSASGR